MRFNGSLFLVFQCNDMFAGTILLHASMQAAVDVVGLMSRRMNLAEQLLQRRSIRFD